MVSNPTLDGRRPVRVTRPHGPDTLPAVDGRDALRTAAKLASWIVVLAAVVAVFVAFGAILAIVF